MDRRIQAWPTEYYQLAISYRPAPQADLHHAEIGRFNDPDLGPVIAYDAPSGPGGVWRDSERAAGRSSVAQPGPRRFDSLPPPHPVSARSGTSALHRAAEQHLSDAILKLFRRLEIGHNLDIEVHAALNAVGVEDVAGLFGWVGSWVSGGRQLDADLAMVIEKLAGATDG